MEKEDMKAFMLYGINGKITFEECIKNEITMVLISILLIYIGINKSVMFLILGAIPGIAYLISIIKLKSINKKPGGKEEIIEGVYYLLHNGISAACYSYIFALAGIEIMCFAFDENERAVIIGIMILGYIVVIFIYTCMIRKLIARNAYDGSAKQLKGGLFFSLFGVLGIIAGRILFGTVDSKSGEKIVCVLAIFLSYLSLIGVFNIFKYKYLMEHKELLEELDTDKKAKQKAKTGGYYVTKTNKRK